MNKYFKDISSKTFFINKKNYFSWEQNGFLSSLMITMNVVNKPPISYYCVTKSPFVITCM